MARSRPLLVERLEDRRVMSVFGVPWPDAANLTLSFVPDGTPVDGSPSVLSQRLNSAFDPAAWQTEILRAFQTWAVNANINIGLVGDGGQALGSTGGIQSDVRFGDIRVAAHSMATHLAINSPFNPMTGTRSGDLVLNSDVPYGIGDPLAYDLYSIGLSEAGNIFGISDSADYASPMYGYYLGIRDGLTETDVALLQELYGIREADDHEGALGNETFANATGLSFASQTSRVVGDVTTLQDADVYRLTNGESTQFTVWLETSGRSLLAGRLSVYDGAGALVSSVTSTSPLQGNVTLTIANAVPSATYYVKVESGTDAVFGIGRYRLTTKLGAGDPASEDEASSKILNDGHSNDTLTSATNLERKRFTTDRRFDNAVQAKIRDASDVDFYRVEAPAAEPGQANSMIVMLWSLENSSLQAKAQVFDAAGAVVPAEVVVNDHGSYVLQVRNAVPDARYYVRVAAADPTSNNVGTYFLGVDFRPETVNMDSAGSGTLSAAKLQSWTTLENRESQVFHFVLPASRDAAVDTAT